MERAIAAMRTITAIATLLMLAGLSDGTVVDVEFGVTVEEEF